jgi:hypothetical protein
MTPDNRQQYSGPGLKDDIQRTLEMLMERNVRVVLVLDVPTQDFDVPGALALAAKWRICQPEASTKEQHFSRSIQMYTAAAQWKASKGLRVVDPAPLIQSWKSFERAGRTLYVDRDHLSDHGALQLAPLFEPIFLEMKTELDSTAVK